MDKFKNITAQQAKDLLTKDNYLIDIRDEDSYSASHIDGALNLGNLNIDQFIRTAEKDIPTIIYCSKVSQVKMQRSSLSVKGLLKFIV